MVRLKDLYSQSNLALPVPCLVLAKPSLVSLEIASVAGLLISSMHVAYKDSSAHHVHAGGDAGEEEDLVAWNHPSATSLETTLSASFCIGVT